ncbi:MAG: HDOD domain-containing protein, partial [Candidatus Sumerlaeota bacterium]|nr:HDOD domain-containing protein [Candidatus Sumerlaeota bacterium]
MKTPVEEKFSQSFDSLPTLSPIALQLLEAAINSDAARIVGIIEKDPAIASKVLQVANSAHYSFRGQVSSLNRAVALLGNEMIRAIALSVSFFRAFESWSEQQGDFDPRDFWKHSLAVALAAQVIGAKSGYGDTGALYAGGLLHDIGRLALYAAHPQAYAAVVAESFNLSKPLIECERAEFGVDHTIIGHNLALRWHLPDQLGECIRYHHVSFTTGAGYPSFHQIIAFADALAHQQWIGSQGYRIPAPLGDDVWKRYGMDRRAEVEIKSVLLDGLRKLAPIFNFDLEADALYLDAVFRANRTLSQMAQELERRGQRLQQDLMRSRFAEVLYARFSPGLSMAETLESAARVISLTLPGVRAAGMIWTPGAAEAQAAVCSGESAASCSSRIASRCFHIANETPLMRSKQFLLALEKDLDEASLAQKMTEGRILIIPFVWLQVLEGCLVVDTRGAEKPLEKWMAKPLGEFAERAATSLERSWLHEDLQRRNEELKQANQMAESFRAQMRNAERLAAAGSMAAGVAHEINNPLSIIRGQAQLLLMREANSDRQNRLRIIDEQSHRISKTLTDLMGIARPSRGVIADVNVAELLSRTLAMFKHRFLHRHIQLAENYDETLPMIKVDPDLLQQLFLNLIINA